MRMSFKMKITKVLLDGAGWIYAKDGKIEWFNLNPSVESPWLRQITKEGLKEYSPTYILEVDYEPEKGEINNK
jgi:hypothetical protein